MPYYVPPESPEDKLFVLEETIQFTADEAAASRPLPIKAATRNSVLNYAVTYRPHVNGLIGALGTRAREVSEADTAKNSLAGVVRDYIEVLKRRTRRLGHNVAVLVNHGLPENGDTPVLSAWADLKRVAEELVNGDVLSAATYGEMANPSAAEVQTALTVAQTEHEDVAPADSAVQVAQNNLAAQQEQADYWVSEIRYDALDFARRENDPGQRRLLRKLGFKFKTLPGETPEDPGDTPAPVTPTAPTS